MTVKPKSLGAGNPLRSRVTCPHCWTAFPPGDILWVAEHPSLTGDDQLENGDQQQQRFLPTRFDVDGNALDVKGVVCHELACPTCHLTIPRALVEMEAVFISTLGAPSSGKSYFLASMVHQTQEAALRHFQSNLTDVDPVANHIVNDYVNKLFRSEKPQELVNLEKTEVGGRQYTSLNMDGRPVLRPKPFVYSLQPLHVQDDRARRQVCRALCLYDNAGEHFMPGKSEHQMATQHLGQSRVLLFLFDPLQHARFRQACMGLTGDPQLGRLGKNNPQDQVLLEASRRVKNFTGLSQHAKHNRPLVVVVTKYDVWHSLLADQILESQALLCRVERGVAIDLKRLNRLSQLTRDLLLELAPDIVAAAEGFCNEVIYLPNSALGCSPEPMRLPSGNDGLGVRPSRVYPLLAEFPLLYALHRAVPTLIPAIDRSAKPEAAQFVPVATPARQPSLSAESIPMVNPSPHSVEAPAPHPPPPLPRIVGISESPVGPRPKVDNYLQETGS